MEQPDLGTQIFTARKGVKVGEDEQGNIYYQTADGKRRWVIYNGEMEASRVTPDWHGWLHHTWDEPPTEAPLKHKAWEKPHQENLTGTDGRLCAARVDPPRRARSRGATMRHGSPSNGRTNVAEVIAGARFWPRPSAFVVYAGAGHRLDRRAPTATR